MGADSLSTRLASSKYLFIFRFSASFSNLSCINDIINLNKIFSVNAYGLDCVCTLSNLEALTLTIMDCGKLIHLYDIFLSSF